MTKYAGRAPYPFTPGDNMTGQCSDCGLAFFGEDAFDRHRRGEEPNRGCIDPSTEPPSERTGRAYWLDSRQRWHYGAPSDADQYEQRASERAQRLKTPRQRPDPGATTRRPALSGVPGTPHVVPVGQSVDPEGAA